RVDPIDADLRAWIAFLDAYAASAAPDELLAQRDLGMNDLARLRRAWDKRMTRDASLVKRAAKLKKDGVPPLPALRVGPRKLVKSPWAGKLPTKAETAAVVEARASA